MAWLGLSKRLRVYGMTQMGRMQEHPESHSTTRISSSAVAYPFPETPLHPGTVEWTGEQFLIGGRRGCQVLCYDQNQSHWSDELTRLHEEECGAHHPIDTASRRLAVRTVCKWSAVQAPVVLDVGCSSGYLIEELRAALPHAVILGADYIPELLERLAMRLRGVPILQFDLRNCPLPDRSLDAVTCLNVLEHVDDDARALKQIHRVLRQGGIAHVEVPAGPHLYDIYDEYLMHHRRYRLAEVTGLAQALGFEVLEATHLGAFIYPGFAFVKRRHRALLSLPVEQKKEIVTRQIRRTGRSLPLDVVLRIEGALGRWLRYPIGIRCVAVLRKAR
jgi:SAM-dependent methyltransferase